MERKELKVHAGGSAPSGSIVYSSMVDQQDWEIEDLLFLDWSNWQDTCVLNWYCHGRKIF
eukprot:7217601-Ditylum_brightwellii.AAC.1